MASVCLRGRRYAKQIEGAALCAGGRGEDGGDAVAPEADDIAGEGGEIAEQGVEAVHRQRFAIYWVGALARGLATRSTSRMISREREIKHLVILLQPRNGSIDKF